MGQPSVHDFIPGPESPYKLTVWGHCGKEESHNNGGMTVEDLEPLGQFS